MAFAVFALASCQQEEAVSTNGYNPSLSARTQNCNTDCLGEGEVSEPTIATGCYTAGPQGCVTVSVTNSNSQICYEITSNNDIKNIVFNGTDLYCNNQTPASQPYIHCVSIGGLAACQVATANIVVRRENCNGNGGGQKVTMDVSHTVIGACEGGSGEICYGGHETGWSDGTRYNKKGNWATYTTYSSNLTKTLFAGQTNNAGNVHFSAVSGGNITITVTLNSGWEFANVNENIKIQDYASAPSGNPAPGQFAHKFTAAIGSSPYSVTVPANNFYGVHLDLVPIVPCP
ncbi:MAG TPA: hypothetical protein VFX48_04070 [Saprospiraceae bacterium]|nr:hypothetical protein [Saprospiraceae bacterium]